MSGTRKSSLTKVDSSAVSPYHTLRLQLTSLSKQKNYGFVIDSKTFTAAT